MQQSSSQKLLVVPGLVVTLAVLHFVPNRVLALAILALFWTVLFSPVSAAEWILVVFASLFFLLQNYVCLKAGLFEFRSKDILLMPYYEPLLWGFYFLSLKRFVSGRAGDDVRANTASVVGLVATSLAFSLFSFDPRALLIATTCSTTILLALFHTRRDIYYGLSALALGLIVEFFGVSTGLWSYPAPDFLGIPYWFATMWISVGLLGRRFLIPVTERAAARLAGHRA